MSAQLKSVYSQCLELRIRFCQERLASSLKLPVQPNRKRHIASRIWRTMLSVKISVINTLLKILSQVNTMKFTSVLHFVPIPILNRACNRIIICNLSFAMFQVPFQKKKKTPKLSGSYFTTENLWTGQKPNNISSIEWGKQRFLKLFINTRYCSGRMGNSVFGGEIHLIKKNKQGPSQQET